jgi:hypothetical protein
MFDYVLSTGQKKYQFLPADKLTYRCNEKKLITSNKYLTRNLNPQLLLLCRSC